MFDHEKQYLLLVCKILPGKRLLIITLKMLYPNPILGTNTNLKLIEIHTLINIP